MRITCNQNGNYTIDQSRYTKSIVKKFLGVTNAKVSNRPLPSEWEASKSQESKNDNETKSLSEKYRIDYASVIGSLIYLLNTRPDITFAVTKLAKFMRRPGREHFRALIHLLQYLCDNTNVGITFYWKVEDSPVYDLLTSAGEKNIPCLFGMHDTSWQDCPDTG